MQFVIVGLGNPGLEYEKTRHNTGRMVVFKLGKEYGVSEWKGDKKLSAEVGKGTVGDSKVTFVLPDTFMNLSGKAVKPLVGSVKAAEKLVVVYDDMDLPFDTVKISFGKNSGGHRGVESIIKALKTKDFIRIRVGVAPTTPSGKIKKPKGEDAVIKFLMSPFKKPEEEQLKKIMKRVKEAVEIIVTETKEKAMSVVK